MSETKINMCFAWNKKHNNKKCKTKKECVVASCDGFRYYKDMI